MAGSLLVAGYANADVIAGDATSGARNVADTTTVLTVGNPIRVLHWNSSTTNAGVAYPENTSLYYNSTIDLTITAVNNSGAGQTGGLDFTAGHTYQLVAPSFGTVGSAVTPSADLEHCGWSAAKVAGYNASTSNPTEKAALTDYMVPCVSASTDTSSRFVNLTFPHAVLNESGTWMVNDTTSNTAVAQFSVASKIGEMTVTLSKTSATYTPTVSGGFFFTITATNQAGGALVGAAVTIFPSISGFTNGALTDATGTATALQSGTPAAGKYLVNVTANVGGSSAADIKGQANLTINAAPLTFAWNSSTAYTGFQNTVSFTPMLPADNAGVVMPVFQTGSSFLNSAAKAYNLSVTYPDGSIIWASSIATGANQTFASALSGCYNATNQLWYGANWTANTTLGAGGSSCPANVSARLVSVLTVDEGQYPTAGSHVSAGQVSFAPGSDFWVGGTYTFGLTLDTVPSLGTDNLVNEYTGSTTFAPTGAASINLVLTESGNTVSTLTVLPTASNALQSHTLALNITGTNVFSHPLCETNSDPGQALARASCKNANNNLAAPSATDEKNFVANVTVTGAVLTGTNSGLVGVPSGNTLGSYNFMTYDAPTGIVTISNVVPTGSGNVVFTATWPGVGTMSLTVPTSQGAVLTSDTTSIQEGQATNFTVSVKDANNNYVTTAQITCIYEDGTTALSNLVANSVTNSCTGSGVQGTGASGLGQGGVYNINETSMVTQNVIIQAKIQAPGGGSTSYALYRLQVTAGHDYNVTTNVADTSAGLPTFLSVKAVNSTGAGVPATTGQLYLLTAQEKKDLLANGTTGLSTVQSGGVTSRHFGTGATALLGNSTTCCLNATVVLGAGTYYVYVQDAAGNALTHDNLNNMPTLTVHNYTVSFAPQSVPVWWIGKSNVTVNATVMDWQGNNAPNGTFIQYSAANSTGALVNPSSHAVNFDAINSTASTLNGKITLTLTAGIPGTLMVEVKPASGLGTSQFTGATGALILQGPGVTFFPESLTQGQTTPLTVTVTNLTGSPLAGLEVRACGQSLNPNFPATLPATLDASQQANCTAVSTTNTQGSVTLSLSPSSASAIEIYVNLTDTNTSVPVFGGKLTLSINNSSPKAGDTVTLTVATSGGIPVPGATLSITHDGTAVTSPSIDNSGHAVLSNLTAGNYSVTGTFATFTPAYLNFTVGSAGGNVTVHGAHFTLSNLTLPDQINVGQPVTVSVDITNDGDAAGTADAILYVGPAGHEAAVATFSFPDLAAGSTQPITFQPYTPVVAGSYHVIVKIGTQAIVDRTVTVGTPTGTTPTSTSTSPTTTTTATSPTTSTTVTSPTVSSSPVTPTSSSTPVSSTTTNPSPKVPGFEVVALIGAIGAALLVLRRKTN
jgi:hypothetical protein